jgi:ABC-2 type transport system permease protein
MFKVKGTIFGFRDYDMVMSLPISTRGVVASRLIILYVLNFLFVIIMMIPMMAAYGVLVNPGIQFYIIGFITLFFIPLIPIVVASLLGTGIAYAATRFKHSNIINIIVSIAFITGIMVFSFSLNGNGKEIVQMSKVMNGKINQIYPLAGMYTDSVIRYDIIAMLTFLGISAGAFLVYTLVVDKVFKKLNTLVMTGSSHSNYKLGGLKASSPFQALYMKELKRFFSSTLYVVNAGLGVVLLTLAAVAAIFVDLDKVIGNKQAVDMMIKISPVYIIFCIIMTCTTMVSISLEGKNFWIIKSVPIAPKTVFLSKIAVNLTIISPAIVDVIILGAVFKLSMMQVMLDLLMTVACAVFISFYGLFINLLLPNFSWTSETVVIKNSAATLVTVFSAMFYVGVLFLLMALISSTMLAFLIYFVMTVLLDAVLCIVLMTYGQRRYYFL